VTEAPGPLTVVVVTYRSEAVLAGCLEALEPELEGTDHRLVVVDNASGDGSVGIAERAGAEVIGTGGNLGYAAAINRGCERAEGDVLIMNPDVRVDPGAVLALRNALAEPGVGIAVPHMRDGGGTLITSLRRRPTVLRALGEGLLGGRRAGRFERLGEIVPAGPAYAAPGTHDWAVGACWMISAECRRQVGPWDERFFLYSEETDFALRAGGAGLGLWFVPRATVVHLEGESRTSPALYARLTINRVTLHRKHRGRASALLMRLALLAGELPRAAIGRATSRAAVRALVGGSVLGPTAPVAG
jgi:GT2 family glycosyltransferase